MIDLNKLDEMFNDTKKIHFGPWQKLDTILLWNEHNTVDHTYQNRRYLEVFKEFMEKI